MTQRTRGRTTTHGAILWLLLCAVVLAAGAVVLAFRGAGQVPPPFQLPLPDLASRMPPPQVRGEQRVQLVIVTSPARVAADAQAYERMPISVAGRVAAAFGPYAFTLDDGWVPLFQDLLVLLPAPTDAAARVEADRQVTATGTLRVLRREELEERFSWFRVLTGIEIGPAGRPVLIADEAQLSGGADLTRTGSSTTRVFVTAPGEIAATPGRFQQRLVSVRGDVADVRSPHLFTLDEDRWLAGPDVLVFTPSALTTRDGAASDGPWDVIGVVQAFERAALPAEQPLFAPARGGAAAGSRLEGRPVVVAAWIADAEGRPLVRQPLTLDTIIRRHAR